MSYHVMLGGVPIVLHAGAPDLSDEEIGGRSVLRLSEGDGVLMQHWKKAAGAISGQGWMPPGLDGLDYSKPLELRTTQVSCIVVESLVLTLTSTPRPDVAPWAFGLVGKQWMKTPCAVVDGVMTITAVPGATLYQGCWMPIYSVFANRPPKTQSSSAGNHGWSISWEEA